MREEFRKFILVVLTVAVFGWVMATPSSATSSAAISIANAVLPATIIEEDLDAGAFHLNPTVGMVHGTFEDSTEGSGYGATLQANYSFTSHIGLSVAAIGFRATGDAPSGTDLAKGEIFSTMVLIDGFSGNGFRLPFVFGPNYEMLDTEMPGGSGVTGVYVRSVGFSAGFSPRFNLGKPLRIEPFFIVNVPIQSPETACALGVAVCPSYSPDIGVESGIDLLFLPLGVSFYYDIASMLRNNGTSYMALGIHF